MKIFEYCPDPKEINDSYLMPHKRKLENIECLNHALVRTCGLMKVTPEEIKGKSKQSNLVMARSLFYAVGVFYNFHPTKVVEFIDRERTTQYNFNLIHTRFMIDDKFYQRCYNSLT